MPNYQQLELIALEREKQEAQIERDKLNTLIVNLTFKIALLKEEYGRLNRTQADVRLREKPAGVNNG